MPEVQISFTNQYSQVCPCMIHYYPVWFLELGVDCSHTLSHNLTLAASHSPILRISLKVNEPFKETLGVTLHINHDWSTAKKWNWLGVGRQNVKQQLVMTARGNLFVNTFLMTVPQEVEAMVSAAPVRECLFRSALSARICLVPSEYQRMNQHLPRR